ncbi:MAG: S8 family serine peptidase [Mycobacteriales bacterium]
MRPAWSEQFDRLSLDRVEPLPLPQRVTREWAWGGATGAGVDVAVLDSGIEAGHPLVGPVDTSVDFIYDPAAPDGVRREDGPHDDLFGHGTACAGIIRSLAPDCRLHSVRVLGSRLTGKGLVLAAGLRWAIDAGMDVVNLSLSTGRDDYFGLFHEIADEAYFAGTVVVCAVNNVPGPSFPAQYASVLSVAAHDGTDPERFDYNPRPPVEFGAPGIDLTVAWNGGASLTTTGNSFAAPHISGLVARLLSKHPGLTPFQVKTVLHALADNAQGDDAVRTVGADA